jgi:hypothetical protein
VIEGVGLFNAGSFGTSGVVINDADNVSVRGTVINSDTTQARLVAAVRIINGDSNTIGGGSTGTPAFQNVMGNYVVGVDLEGTSRHNNVVGNFVGQEPFPDRVPRQEVGVFLRPLAFFNTVASNVQYKNVTPYIDEAISGNVIVGNTVIPR